MNVCICNNKVESAIITSLDFYVYQKLCTHAVKRKLGSFCNSFCPYEYAASFTSSEETGVPFSKYEIERTLSNDEPRKQPKSGIWTTSTEMYPANRNTEVLRKVVYTQYVTSTHPSRMHSENTIHLRRVRVR